MTKPTWTLRQWQASAPPDGVRAEQAWRVGGLARQENIELITLANLGMTRNTISQFTGLSPYQVSYRLKYFGIRIKDFREGRGPIAGLVFTKLANRVTQASIQLVREHI